MCLLASWIQRCHLSAIWREIVDYKYKINNHNIFCCPDIGTSLFGKGLCGQLRLLGLATARTLVMVVGPGFGKTVGLAV